MSEDEKTELELPTGEFDENHNPDLDKQVPLDNELKTWFVNYVGKKEQPEDGVVTVAHVVKVLAEEFPEFLLVVAEENWIAGYRQGVHDSEQGVRAALEQAGVEPQLAVELSSWSKSPLPEAGEVSEEPQGACEISSSEQPDEEQVDE